MENLEQEILTSMIEAQEDIEAFLEQVPRFAFSAQGKEILDTILHLKDNKTLSRASFLDALSSKFKESDYFLDFLTILPNPNFLQFSGVFKEQYLLKTQAEIGLKLQEASAHKQLLDLSLFSKELEVDINAPKTLDEWGAEYDKKPKKIPYKTRIPFVDNCFEGGFTTGQLMLIFGEPEAGKTMFGLQILENLSKTTKVAFFCFEFTIDDYLKRRRNSSFVENSNFYIFNDGYDITQVAQNIKTLAKKGAKFFLIDSQMRLTCTQGRSSEEEESLKFSTLAKLCHSLDIFVLFICQNSKNDKDNPLGSKKGGHEASIIIHIERVKLKKQDQDDEAPAEYDPFSRIFKIKKNKQTGKHYKDKILFDKDNLRFYEEHERARGDVQIIYEIPTI